MEPGGGPSIPSIRSTQTLYMCNCKDIPIATMLALNFNDVSDSVSGQNWTIWQDDCSHRGQQARGARNSSIIKSKLIRQMCPKSLKEFTVPLPAGQTRFLVYMYKH